MGAAKLLSVAAVLVFALFQTANCISCYSCTSTVSTGCDPFNSTLVGALNCDQYYPETTECIAYSVTYKNQKSTTRTCASYVDDKKATKASCSYVEEQAGKQNATVESCYTCNSHMCNAADSKGAAAGAVFAAALLGFLGLKR